MTLMMPTEFGQNVDENLAVAEELFQEAGAVLGQKLLQFKQDDYEAKGLKTAMNELSVAWQIASKERSRVVEERKKEQGIVGSYAIDIGRARAEIGRRLARLRNDREIRDLSE